MWVVVWTDVYGKIYKWYSKKKKAELTAVLSNLDTFQRSLRDGHKPKPFLYGFLHSEPADIIAIDQRGSGVKLAETRLYIFPDVESSTIYLLTIGDKSSQAADIQDCKRFVAQIRAGSPQMRDVEDEDEGERDGPGGTSGIVGG